MFTVFNCNIAKASSDIEIPGLNYEDFGLVKNFLEDNEYDKYGTVSERIEHLIYKTNPPINPFIADENGFNLVYYIYYHNPEKYEDEQALKMLEYTVGFIYDNCGENNGYGTIIEPNMPIGTDGETILQCCAGAGAADLVYSLIDSGEVDINLPDNSGTTALMEAVKFYKIETIKPLLEAKADPFQSNIDGDTAVSLFNPDEFNNFTGFENGEDEFYYYTIDYIRENYGLTTKEGIFIDIDMPLNKNGETLIHLAAKTNCESTVDALLNINNELINIQDTFGYTPLMTAIRNESVEVALYLFSRNIDPSLRDKEGIDPNLIDREGNTLLHIAVIGYFEQIHSIYFQYFEDSIDRLIIPICDGILQGNISMQNNMGKTPLHIAAEKAKDDEGILYNKLIELGANGFLLDNNGKKAKQYLEEEKNEEEEEEENKEENPFELEELILKGRY